MNSDMEYQSLRQEILHHMKHKAELEVGYVTLSVLILAFPLSKGSFPNPIYYYLPPLVCLIATYFMLQMDRTVRGIATYLKVFHEDRGSGPLWETALHHIRIGQLPQIETLRKDIWLRETFIRSAVPMLIMLISLMIKISKPNHLQLYDVIVGIVFLGFETMLVWSWKSVFSAQEVENAVRRWELVLRAIDSHRHHHPDALPV